MNVPDAIMLALGAMQLGGVTVPWLLSKRYRRWFYRIRTLITYDESPNFGIWILTLGGLALIQIALMPQGAWGIVVGVVAGLEGIAAGVLVVVHNSWTPPMEKNHDPAHDHGDIGRDEGSR